MQNPLKSESLQNFVRRHRGKLVALQVIVLVGVGYGLASWMGSGGGQAEPATPTNPAKVTQVAEGPSMWTCSQQFPASKKTRKNGG